MDFGNALFLVAAVYGIVELAKKMIPKQYVTPRITVLVVLAASFISVFLIGGTVWAHEQVVGGQVLSDLDVWDKVVVSLFLAGATVFGRNTFDAVRNIGANQPPDTAPSPPAARTRRPRPTVVAPPPRPAGTQTLPPGYPYDA